jgi:serine/threonine-protein kinase RsbT
MTVLKHETVAVHSDEDIVHVRHLVREWARQQGFGLVEQTKIVTAASELARNMVHYGGGGVLRLEVLHQRMRCGLQLTFEDRGPGIADIELAMKDGYTTGYGLGLGLGGAKRLAHEFDIVSRPGEGTRVRIVQWK